MTDEIDIEPIEEPARVSSKWTLTQMTGTRVGRGGVREKAYSGIDRIRYNGVPVGNCGRKPGSVCHITHPVEEISEADYADLMRLLSERDADRYNRIYAKGDTPKTPADFLDRELDKVTANLDPDTLD